MNKSNSKLRDEVAQALEDDAEVDHCIVCRQVYEQADAAIAVFAKRLREWYPPNTQAYLHAKVLADEIESEIKP